MTKPMTDIDVLMLVAKDSIAKSGALPEGFAELLTRVQLAERVAPVKTKRPSASRESKVQEAAIATDWTKVQHTCPQCGTAGSVASTFGTKTVRGVERRQSWCFDCRSKTNYHDKDRKNSSKHNR